MTRNLESIQYNCEVWNKIIIVGLIQKLRFWFISSSVRISDRWRLVVSKKRKNGAPGVRHAISSESFHRMLTGRSWRDLHVLVCHFFFFLPLNDAEIRRDSFWGRHRYTPIAMMSYFTFLRLWWFFQLWAEILRDSVRIVKHSWGEGEGNRWHSLWPPSWIRIRVSFFWDNLKRMRRQIALGETTRGAIQRWNNAGSGSRSGRSRQWHVSCHHWNVQKCQQQNPPEWNRIPQKIRGTKAPLSSATNNNSTSDQSNHFFH